MNEWATTRKHFLGRTSFFNVLVLAFISSVPSFQGNVDPQKKVPVPDFFFHLALFILRTNLETLGERAVT